MCCIQETGEGVVYMLDCVKHQGSGCALERGAWSLLKLLFIQLPTKVDRWCRARSSKEEGHWMKICDKGNWCVRQTARDGDTMSCSFTEPQRDFIKLQFHARLPLCVFPLRIFCSLIFSLLHLTDLFCKTADESVLSDCVCQCQSFGWWINCFTDGIRWILIDDSERHSRGSLSPWARLTSLLKQLVD